MEAEKEMLSKHEAEIHENILPRLDALEQAQAIFQQEVSKLTTDLMGVQKGQAQLEVTLLKEGQLNREIMTENKALTNKLLEHVLGKDEKETQAEIDNTKAKWELIGKISVALVSSGSILYLIVEAVSK